MLLKKDARAGYNAGDDPELPHIWTDYLSLRAAQSMHKLYQIPLLDM